MYILFDLLSDINRIRCIGVIFYFFNSFVTFDA